MKKYEYLEIDYTAKGVVFLCTDKHKEVINSYAENGYRYVGFIPTEIDAKGCMRKIDDYSGTLRATCPDFESHHSGEWEPYIPVIQSHLIGLYYIYFLYTVNTHLWCEYR